MFPYLDVTSACVSVESSNELVWSMNDVWFGQRNRFEIHVGRIDRAETSLHDKSVEEWDWVRV